MDARVTDCGVAMASLPAKRPAVLFSLRLGVIPSLPISNGSVANQSSFFNPLDI